MSEVKFDGEKLFKIRKAKKLSQEKLANAIGVTRQTVYSWESNQSSPDIDKISRICNELKVDISELVDGMKNNIEVINNNNNMKKRNNKVLLKVLVLFFSLLIIIYFVISIVKFKRLYNIIKKWNKLNEINNYYMKVEEYLCNNSDTILENLFTEKFFDNGNLTIIVRDIKNKEIDFIIKCDYNNNIKYVINECEKTYVKSKIDWRYEKGNLMDNYQNNIKFTNNLFREFIFCFNPFFSIRKYEDNYEIIYNGYKEIVDIESGIIEYIYSSDNRTKNSKTYYQVELNTKKDFEIDLSQYTEVTQ